jgi:peptidoglycan hydrolase-like protein with peptidoglycan-binding domain
MTWTLPGRGGTATVLHPTIKKGDRGIVVWAFQKALDDLYSIAVTPDGDFGPHTYDVVRAFQKGEGLTMDGVAGPVTQKHLVTRHVVAHRENVPKGLMDGFAAMEGGWLIAPMNWSTPGGVDCGAFQRRVYAADYGNNAVIERAFNTGYQARLLCGNLLELRSIFGPRAGTRDGSMDANEKAWRLAALNHNYPSAADRLSRTPIKSLTSYWTSAQEWVSRYGFKFPDGWAVRTPLEWAHLYAGVLDGAHGHRGNVTKNVSDWTP